MTRHENRSKSLFAILTINHVRILCYTTQHIFFLFSIPSSTYFVRIFISKDYFETLIVINYLIKCTSKHYYTERTILLKDLKF